MGEQRFSISGNLSQYLELPDTRMNKIIGELVSTDNVKSIHAIETPGAFPKLHLVVDCRYKATRGEQIIFQDIAADISDLNKFIKGTPVVLLHRVSGIESDTAIEELPDIPHNSKLLFSAAV